MSRVAAGFLPWSFRHKYDHCRAARYSLFVILFHLPKIFSTPQQIDGTSTRTRTYDRTSTRTRTVVLSHAHPAARFPASNLRTYRRYLLLSISA